MPRVQISPHPKRFYPEKFAGGILAGGICGGGFLVFLYSFGELWTGFWRRNFVVNFCKKFALFAFARALHKILRRSCRDFTPLLQRFLEYKARKFCCRPPHRKNFNEGRCAARAIVDGNVTLCGRNFTCNSPQNFERILP